MYILTKLLFLFPFSSKSVRFLVRPIASVAISQAIISAHLVETSSKRLTNQMTVRDIVMMTGRFSGDASMKQSRKG